MARWLRRLASRAGLVVHTFNPSTKKAEAGESLSSRSTLSTEGIPGQQGLGSEDNP